MFGCSVRGFSGIKWNSPCDDQKDDHSPMDICEGNMDPGLPNTQKNGLKIAGSSKDYHRYNNLSTLLH